MKRTRSAVVAVAAPLLALLAVPCLAQSDRFGEEISITEVEIPVQVLHRGEPVRGLTAEDFEVYDDGVRREITGFRVVDLGRSVAAPAEEAADSPAVAEHDPEGRRLLLLFDLLFSRRHHLERSLLGAEEMLAGQLHPSDRVAVAYLTGGGANLLLGFSRDREEVATALATLHAILEMRPEDARVGLERLARGRAPATGGDADGAGAEPARTRVGELNDRFGAAAAVAMLGGADPETDPVFSATFGSGEWPLAQGFGDGEVQTDPVAAGVANVDPFAIGASLAAEAEASAIRTLTLEMSRLATLLRDVPGQKHMLYFSEGFTPSILTSFGSGIRALVLRHVENLFESLRRGGWTLHAVDVGGIPDPFGEAGFSAEALHYMAAESGGQLFENYNRIHQATERLIERTSVTYVLTIRPGDLATDGRLHRLEVRLADRPRRTRVHHRPGYYAPKAAGERTRLERQLDHVDMVLGERELDQLVTRSLAGSLPAEDGLVAVPIVIEIPGDELARGGGPVDLHVQVYAVDPAGGVQDLWLRRLRLDPSQVDDLLSRGGLRMLGALAVPPGEYRLRILVEDVRERRLSLSSRELSAGAGGELLPLDPIIIDRSGRWLEVVSLPEGPGAVAGRALAMGAAPVVPAVSPAVGSWQEAELLVVVAEGAPVKLAGRLLDDGGRELPSTVRFIERLPGTDDSFSRYLGRVATAELDPGRYRLEVRATRDGAETSVRHVFFDVHE